MTYDAIIMGAGLVGTTLALALKQSGFHVALIDAKPRLSPENANDLRTVALSPTSVRWLQRVGVWQALMHEEKSPYTTMSIFEPKDPHILTFSAQDAGIPCLGYMVSHDRLLLKAQSLFQGQTFFETRIDREAQLQHWPAHVVIGCDGADSYLRQQLGITQQTHDYEQRALVAELACTQWHEHTAWQSFSQGSIMGLLPLHDRHRVNMVWSLDTATATAMMKLPPLELNAHIQSVFGDRLGTLSVTSRLGMFPLVARHAHSYGTGPVILLGDAIHTVHPLAGQGVNLGFLDAAVLHECLLNAGKEKWGSAALCKQFERRRKAHNFLMTHLMTALQQGYAQSGMLGRARNIGVRALNRLPGVKQLLVQALQ